MSDGAFDLVQARFPGAIFEQPSEHGIPTWKVDPLALLDVATFLRDEPETRYDMLTMLAKRQDELDYQLASLSHRRRLRLRVAARPELDSLAFIWPAANWAEREAYGRSGTRFAHHPDLRPLFGAADGAAQDCTMALDTGWRYPTSQEGLALQLELEGDKVDRVQLVLGRRRCGLERQLESRPYGLGILLAARMDGFAAMHADLAYALAIEQFLDITPLPRAGWLRVIYGELQRIASHLFWLTRCVQRLCPPSFVASSYAWQGRTAILDLFQQLGGNPITPDVIVIGGVKRPPLDLEHTLRDLISNLSVCLGDLDVLLEQNPVLHSRLAQIGVIDPGTALGLGVTGPNLRAAGIAYDVRRAFPYAAYAQLDVPVVVESGGDAYSRCRVRMAEMRHSLQLVEQALVRLAPGEVCALERDALPPCLPAGTAYGSVESPRGELGMYLVSDGTASLQRAYVRAPSLAHLSALPFVARNALPEQVAPILDSLDISIGEAER